MYALLHEFISIASALCIVKPYFRCCTWSLISSSHNCVQSILLLRIVLLYNVALHCKNNVHRTHIKCYFQTVPKDPLPAWDLCPAAVLQLLFPSPYVLLHKAKPKYEDTDVTLDSREKKPDRRRMYHSERLFPNFKASQQ